MSYAGPAGQKNIARPPLKRPAAPRSSASIERNVAFLTGVAVGAAVGAGVALLLAPRSGRSTRRRILSKGRRFQRRGHDAWQDLARELHDARVRRRERKVVEREVRDAAEADDGDTRRRQRKSFSFRAASSL
jgi:hypothetical protein